MSWRQQQFGKNKFQKQLLFSVHQPSSSGLISKLQHLKFTFLGIWKGGVMSEGISQVKVFEK
jgi:hypothetical protein